MDMKEKAGYCYTTLNTNQYNKGCAEAIERIGFENVQSQLLGDELLKRKTEILGLNIVSGASC